MASMDNYFWAINNLFDVEITGELSAPVAAGSDRSREVVKELSVEISRKELMPRN